MEIENTTTSSTTTIDMELLEGLEVLQSVGTTTPKVKATANVSRGPMAKHWAGCTWNNPPAGWKAWFAKLTGCCTYYVAGEEVGASGTKHIQFMLCLTAQKRASTILKLFPTPVHLEVKSKFSTMLEASAYCKKDGKFIEWGNLPDDQHVAGLKVIVDNYADTLAKAKLGRIDEIIPKHQIVHYKTIKSIQHDNKPMPADLTWTPGNQPNEWIYGPTRTGKSWKARQENPGAFSKMPNKWWDRYAGQSTVIIEDLGHTHEYLGDHLKIWADVYAFPVEVKCSGDSIRPAKIVVTSNYSIAELFPDPNVHEPLLQRFREIHLTQAWDASITTTLGKKPGIPPRAPKKKIQRRSKYNLPLTRPPMYRQNASGDLVPWYDTQPKFAGAITSTAKMPRPLTINISDSTEDSYSTEVSDSDGIESFGSDSEEIAEQKQYATDACECCWNAGNPDNFCSCNCHPDPRFDTTENNDDHF